MKRWIVYRPDAEDGAFRIIGGDEATLTANLRPGEKAIDLPSHLSPAHCHITHRLEPGPEGPTITRLQ